MGRGGLLLLLPLLLAPCAPAVAKDDPAPVTDEERDRAIDRSLAYLATTFPRLPEPQGTPRRQFTAAATGFVFLLAGDRTATRRSKRQVLIADLKDYLIRYLEEVEERSREDDELPLSHGAPTSWTLCQYTWPCAVSSLFFAEMHQRGLYVDEAKDAVHRLVTVLGEAQHESGGWGHGRSRASGKPTEREKGPRGYGSSPLPLRAGLGYPPTLTASSALVAASLGLVRQVMAPPGTEFLDKAVTYFKDAQLRNGNMPYDPSQRSADLDGLGAGRVAGAVFALHALGRPLTDRTIKRSLKYLDAHAWQVAEGHGSATLTLLFGALAAKVRGEKAWKAYRTMFVRPMLDAQRKDGAFVCIARETSPGTTNDSKPPGGASLLRKGADAYVTAIHTWILLLDRETPKVMTPDRTSPATPR